MTYVTVQDMKRSRELWKRLRTENELVVTKDGKPCAILVNVSPDGVECSLKEIRRALFSSAVGAARRRAETAPVKKGDIEQEIRESRRRRMRS